MKLTEINFPVFKLSNIKPNQIEDTLFYLIGDKYYVVDDRAIEAPSLALRRLQLKALKIKLYPLKQAIFFIADLVKLSSPNQWFIDSSGYLFKYIKKKLVPLIFRKITKVIRGDGSCIVEVEGLPQRFRSLYPPLENQEYAGLLRIQPKAYILYGFYYEKHKDTVRKV